MHQVWRSTQQTDLDQPSGMMAGPTVRDVPLVAGMAQKTGLTGSIDQALAKIGNLVSGGSSTPVSEQECGPKNGREVEAQRVRRVRVTHTNENRSTPGTGGKPKNTNFCKFVNTPRGCVKEGCQYIHPEKNDKFEEILEDHRQQVKLSSVYYSARNDREIKYSLYSDIHGGFTNNPGWTLVDDAVEVTSGNDYTAVLDPQGKTTQVVRLQPATVTVELPYFEIIADGKMFSFPKQTYYLYRPLLKQWAHIRATATSIQLMSTFTRPQLYLSVPRESDYIIESTIEYQKRIITQNYALARNNAHANLNTIEFCEMTTKGYFPDEDSNVTRYHQPVKLYDVECELPLDWVDSLRSDFTWSTRKIDPDTNLFTFADGKTKQTYRTMLCSFEGLGLLPMVRYRQSANNLTHGLKRMLAARPDEEKYRNLALMLGEQIFYHYKHRLPRVYKSRGIIVEVSSDPSSNGGNIVQQSDFHEVKNDTDPRDDRVYNMLLGGRKYQTVTYASSDDEYRARYHIADKVVNQLIRRCTRSTIDRATDTVVNAGKWAYYQLYQSYLTHISNTEARQVAAQIVHIKKELRKKMVSGTLYDVGVLISAIEIMIKMELSKWGKVPRLFASYASAAMFANELPAYVKKCITGEYAFYVGNIHLIVNLFTETRVADIGSMFNDLFVSLSCSNTLYVAIFSDDTVFGGNVKNEHILFNGDIASNDSSQDLPAFLSVYFATKQFQAELAEGLMEQCMKPFTIRSPTKRSSVVQVKFQGPFEGSGVCITSVLNHFASFMIAVGTAFMLSEGLSVLDAYTIGAALVGHSVTMDNCIINGVVKFEHVQFLKYSPAYVDYQWVPYRNLGCLFRNFGKLSGDLEAKQLSSSLTQQEFHDMSWNTKMDMYCGSVVAGWVHEPHSRILDALRARFPQRNDIVIKDESYDLIVDIDRSSFSSVDDAICTRYNIDKSDIDYLCDQIHSIRVGDKCVSTAVAQFLHIDYGVGYAERNC